MTAPRALVSSVMDRIMRALPGSGTAEGDEARAAYAEGGEAALEEFYAELAFDEITSGGERGLGRIRNPFRRKKKHRGGEAPTAPAPTTSTTAASATLPSKEPEATVAPAPPLSPAVIERVVTVVMTPVAEAANQPPPVPATVPPDGAPAPAKSEGGLLIPVLAVLALFAGGG